MAPLTLPPVYDGPELSFVAAVDLVVGLRVKIDSNEQLAIAGATDLSDGIVWGGDYIAGEVACMRRHGHGTTVFIAADTFVVGAKLYAAAAGKVTDTANLYQEGKALSAATAADNIVRAISQQQDRTA